MFEAFPQVVQAELERMGQNQRWLAKQLGVSHVSVSNWLSGKRRPSASSIEAVAQAFNRSASWLYEQMELGPMAMPMPPVAPEEERSEPGARVMSIEEHEAVFARSPCPTCGHKTEAA